MSRVIVAAAAGGHIKDTCSVQPTARQAAHNPIIGAIGIEGDRLARSQIDERIAVLFDNRARGHPDGEDGSRGVAERVGPGLLVFSGVLVASIAYAMQFVSDRLAWAGEMRSYEDALEVFRRASSALTAIARADVDAAERKIRQDTIIETLGIEALKENESWLRAHRERPLEPLPPA